MAVFRLWGPRWGLLALATLAIGYTESGAPQWLWIAALVGEGLHRALPDGTFARAIGAYRLVVLAALLLVSLAFGVRQVRMALHPTLERPASVIEFVRFNQEADSTVLAEDVDDASRSDRPARQEVRGKARGFSQLASSPPSARYARYAPDPQAQITTGPGLPNWSWRRVDLSWSGPVDRNQPLHFTLIPPWLVSLLGIVRVGLLAALVFCFARGALGAGPGALRRWVGPGAATTASMLGALLILAPAGAARAADVPPDATLDELRARLLEQPDCHPDCATISKLRILVRSGVLTLQIEADAAAETAIPLPGSARAWGPTSVRLDGKRAQALRHDQKGVLWLQLPPGRHRITASGPLPDRDSIELPLPLQPHFVEAQVNDDNGWEVHGLREDGLAESTLQLTRTARETAATVEAREFPPFLTVVRDLQLGLHWRLQTTVTRQTPNDTPVVIEVPLLEG